MQNKMQQRISNLLNAHKHKRKWKFFTAILSVLVLCNTFYAMHNAAVAVTQKNARLTQLESAVEEALSENAQDVETLIITASENEETDDPATSDDPADVGADPTDPQDPTAGEDPYVEDPVIDPIYDDPATEYPVAGDDPYLVDGDGWTDDVLIDESDVLGVNRAPALAPQRTPAIAKEIESAVPTFIRVKDAYGNPVTQVRENASVTVELGWDVLDPDEVEVDGDYIDILLPAELEFPEGDGTFRLDKTATLPDGSVVLKDAVIADYEIVGSWLRITYRDAAVRLNDAGMLTPSLTITGRQWSQLTIGNVRVVASDDFTPEIVVNNKRAAYRAISVIGGPIGQIKDVEITRFVIDGKETGVVEANEFDEMTFDIYWSWRGTSQFISTGDWYEIELPERFTYNGVDTVGTDEGGNDLRLQILRRETDRKWVVRVTYENVVSGYNQFSGHVKTTAYVPAISTGGASETMTLRVQVADGASYKERNIRILPMKLDTTDGSVYITRAAYKRYEGNKYGRWQTEDYIVQNEKYQISAGGNSDQWVGLYVISNRNPNAGDNQSLDLSPYPFADSTYDLSQGYIEDDQVLNWVCGASNYYDTFCAEVYNKKAPNTAAPGTAKYVKVALSDQFTALKAETLDAIIKTSYPFVSLQTMADNLKAWTGYSSISQDEALVAVQLAIWRVVEDRDSVATIVKAPDNRAETIARALRDYAAYVSTGSGVIDTGNYEFAENPTLTFDATGTRATVTGKITPAPVPAEITGSFTSDDNKSVAVTIDRRTGEFTATLYGVSKKNSFSLNFSGEFQGVVQPWYFRSTNGYQNLISADCTKRTVKFSWEFQGETSRKVKVVKEWLDEDGAVMTTAPDKEVKVQLYRNGAPYGDPVILNKSNGFAYLWEDLDYTDENGKTYAYTVSEVGEIAGYEYLGAKAGKEGEDILVFTCQNQEAPEYTKLKVVKQWHGIAEGSDPGEVRVQLFALDTAGNRQPLYILNQNRYLDGDNHLVLTGNYTTDASAGGARVIMTLRKAHDANLSYAGDYTLTFDHLPKYAEVDGTLRLIRYEVEEVSGPADFIVTYEQAKMQGDDPTAYVHNTKDVKVDIDLIKYDAENTGKTLEGAEFALYLSEGDGASSSMTEIGTYTTDANGRITFRELELYKTYVLQETKAPSGYILSTDPVPMIIFKLIDDDGTPTIEIVKDAAEITTVDNDTLALKIANKPSHYVLPEAGGMGTKTYTAGGMTLICATALMYITLQFMSKKEKGGRKNHKGA